MLQLCFTTLGINFGDGVATGIVFFAGDVLTRRFRINPNIHAAFGAIESVEAGGYGALFFAQLV